MLILGFPLILAIVNIYDLFGKILYMNQSCIPFGYSLAPRTFT